MDLDDSTVLEAGRAVRPYLAELFDKETAAVAVDDSLAAALCAPEDEASTARAVRAVLEKYTETALWTWEFAKHRVPPDVVVHTRKGKGPTGLGGVVHAQRFACPENGNYVWYRRSASLPVPLCPDHGVRLVPRPLEQR